MRIERFQIQNFKSIVDLTVDQLSDINVFFGLNSVGKSNIFQALELWRWLLGLGLTAERVGGRPVKYVISWEKLETQFGSSLARLGNKSLITIRVELTGDHADNISIKPNQLLFVNLGLRLATQEVKCEVEFGIKQRNGEVEAELPFEQLVESLSKFHVIHATRRLQMEQRTNKNQIDSIDHSNLKQALFYAYLSPDLAQKKRLTAIKQLLADAPFALGELDIALDPALDRINIGFIRPEGRLPIENLGTGAQQLLLVLGQIFLNDYPIIGIEEPEMNLSPQYQAHFMATLRKLMAEPAVKLNQLLISTHSPYLEFTENFYDVTLHPVKGTQILRATDERYGQHFAVTPVGPDTGARINSLEQVKLYDGLIQDLGLQRGDLVIFVRNEAGRWEVRPAREIAHELHKTVNGLVAS